MLALLRRYLLFVALFAGCAPVTGFAQPRPVAGTTLQSTDTSANSVLVGCAIGSTTCTGGIKAGALAVATIDATGAVTLTNATAAIIASSANPITRYVETDAAVDTGHWRFIADSGAFALQVRNDAENAGANVFTASRSTTTATTFAVGANQLAVSSGSNTSPGLTFSADASMDTGLYLIGANNMGVSVGGTLRSQWDSTGAFIHDYGHRNTNAIQPTGLASDPTNNYNPTGFSTAFAVFANSSLGSPPTLTGMVAAGAGDTKYLCNYGGSQSILLAHESGSSTAANRFVLPGASTLTLSVGKCVVAYYWSSLSRWFVTGT